MSDRGDLRWRVGAQVSLLVSLLTLTAGCGGRSGSDPHPANQGGHVTTALSPSDPIVARLAADAYGDPWNYETREAVIDAIWDEAGATTDRLVAIAADEGAPIKSRFLACEVLFEHELTGIGEIGDGKVADIYVAALLGNLTGRANSWGLLYEHNDEGPVGIRFVMIGKAAVGALRPLLADDRQTMTYEGSEEATVGNAYGFRVKDYAAYYLSKILRRPLAYHADPVDRDLAIDAFARALPP